MWWPSARGGCRVNGSGRQIHPFRKCNALGRERQSLCTTPQCSTLEVILKTGACKATRPRIKPDDSVYGRREELTKKANAARDAAMVAADPGLQGKSGRGK